MKFSCSSFEQSVKISKDACFLKRVFHRQFLITNNFAVPLKFGAGYIISFFYLLFNSDLFIVDNFR